MKIYDKPHISFSSSWKEKMFQKKIVEKIKKHILCPITFSENCAVCEIM
jgi:hypothetical protein